MEPITYTNIVVEGVPFTKVLALEIAHAINEHGDFVSWHPSESKSIELYDGKGRTSYHN